MQIVRIILGLVCLTGAFFLCGFAWGVFIYGDVWFKFIPAMFVFGLAAIGLFLIWKRRSPLSNCIKGLMVAFFGVFILLAAVLDLHIRHERCELQSRARAFLDRPIPKLLVPDSEGYVGGYYVGTNADIANGVFGYSRVLIERYAAKGRIRWSAAIQGEFAFIGDNCLNPNISDDVTTNKEVRLYSAESHAILAKEWRMGFWQFVEDSIEFKLVIPEIEEEDHVGRF